MLREFGNTLMLVMGPRVAGIFVLATASLGLTTSVLPRWFAFVSYAFGVVLPLAPFVDQLWFLAFPVWVISLSVLLAYHVAKLPPDQVPGFSTHVKTAS